MQEESRSRVGWFFRHEGDMMPSTPMLFDFDRWGQCDEAIVAEEDGEILGVVTLASNGIENSGQPTLDTLYVPKRHCGMGLGYALFERGIRRLADRRPNDNINCDLQSSIMLKLVAKLPDDLKSRLQIQESFRSGDLAEDFE